MVARALILASAVALASCDSTAPAVATTVVPRPGSPTTAVVGTTITPGVLVSDQDGNPMGGVTVTFAVQAPANGPAGSITGSSTTVTDANGIASVSGWTLGTTTGSQTLRATVTELPPVDLTVTATVGAAALITKVSGDNTAAESGAGVTTLPKVRVADAFNNRISGASVTFTVVSGGRTITGGTATTDASGEASLSSWTLGSTGANTVTAAVAGAPSVTFTATAVVKCTFAMGTPIAMGGSASGDIAATDCRAVVAQARFSDVYTFTLATQTSVAITMQRASGANPYLAIFNTSGFFLGESVDVQAGATTAVVRAILPAGSYGIATTTSTLNATMSYTLSLGVASDISGSCGLWWITPGITTSQSLDASDCKLSDSQGGVYFADQFGISLQAQSSTTVDMTSTAFDSWIDVFDLAGNGVASNDNASAGTTNSRLVLVPPVSGYFLIFPNTALPQKSGNYQLSVTSGAGATPAAAILRRKLIPGAAGTAPQFIGKPIGR